MASGSATLVVPAVPDRADREVLLRRLAAFEAEKAGPLEVAPLAILLKDEAGRTIGGLWGTSLFRWLVVELLFVPEELRGQGTGTAIMRQAEAIARARGCIGMWLDTYDFQAPAFYAALGFEAFGQIEDQPPGHRRIFMRKRWAEG